MNDQNDDAQNHALMVLAGVIALTIAIVLMVATRTGLGMHRAAPSGAAGAVQQVMAGEPEGRVYFAIESDALPADANEVLVRVADTARRQDGRVVLISGFHDASGDPAANVELAKKRAEAVRHALEADGVAPDRLVLDKPAVSTGSGDPKEARRVELRLR